MRLPRISGAAASSVLAAILLTSIVGPGVFSSPCPEHGDTVFYIELARQHSLRDPRLFSHGQWPGGYPALLRVATLHLGLHPVHVGRVLSLATAVIALVSCMSLATRCAGEFAGITTGIVLFANPLFLGMAATEGTDMPAAGLVALSIALLAGCSSCASPSVRRAFSAGCVLGLSYMFRYTALVAMPVAIGAVVVSGARVRAPAGYLAGFAIGASPQLVASTLVRGSPLYNELARNAWLAMHGGTDSAPEWSSAPAGISLFDVIREDVLGFVTHWIREAGGYLVAGTGWPHGAVLFVVAAIAIASLNRQIPLWRRFVLVGLPLCATGATALAFFLPRHGLVSTCGLGVVLGVSSTTARAWLARRRWPVAVGAAIVGGAVMGATWCVAWSIHSFATRPTMRMIQTRHRLMQDLGLTDVREVASNHEGLVDTDSRWLARYQTLEGHWSAQGAEDLLTFARRPEEVRFIVLDLRAFWGDFLAVKRQVDEGGSPLTPIHRGDSLEVYMVRPGGIGDAAADGIEFAAGVRLMGHTWVWRGEKLVVYLYWTATERLAERYAVEVRLVDPGGRVLVSHTGEPELGTYPTTRWEVGKTVVDAHILQVPASVEGGDVEVCIASQVIPFKFCHRLWPVRRGGRTPLP